MSLIKRLSTNQIIGYSIGISVLFVLLAYAGRKIYLSAKQENFVKDLHPQVQNKFRKLIDEIQKKTGWEMIITSGYRDFAKQASLKRQNPKNARAGYSEHNYGIALDMVAKKDGERLYKSTSKGKWLETGIPQIAKGMGFRWGGDFANYHDPVHFGLGHIYDTKKLLAQAEQRFGTDPNNIRGNEVSLIA
tara:strand:+ start:565 stop:1134 length:570 start_codon:yes stop_codon:yes gene_type:complete